MVVSRGSKKPGFTLAVFIMYDILIAHGPNICIVLYI